VGTVATTNTPRHANGYGASLHLPEPTSSRVELLQSSNIIGRYVAMCRSAVCVITAQGLES